MIQRPVHWNGVYDRAGDRGVSWFEAAPDTSLALLESARLSADTCVIDIGGGESRLVDALLARGLRCLTVLDVSRVALEETRRRLGAAATIPEWIEADVTGEWTARPVDIWHDRAVFHFLTDAADRDRYRIHLDTTLKVGGRAIMATFAPDGPEKCSGLPVVRYSSASLSAELGDRFGLVESRQHLHRTPWDVTQSFQYSHFVRVR